MSANQNLQPTSPPMVECIFVITAMTRSTSTSHVQATSERSAGSWSCCQLSAFRPAASLETQREGGCSLTAWPIVSVSLD